MKTPSKEEIKAEMEKIRKIYECYCFLYANADDEPTRKRIQELARSHFLAKVKATSYYVQIAAQRRIAELDKKIADLTK